MYLHTFSPWWYLEMVGCCSQHVAEPMPQLVVPASILLKSITVTQNIFATTC